MIFWIFFHFEDFSHFSHILGSYSRSICTHATHGTSICSLCIQLYTTLQYMSWLSTYICSFLHTLEKMHWLGHLCLYTTPIEHWSTVIAGFLCWSMLWSWEKALRILWDMCITLSTLFWKMTIPFGLHPDSFISILRNTCRIELGYFLLVCWRCLCLGLCYAMVHIFYLGCVIFFWKYPSFSPYFHTISHTYIVSTLNLAIQQIHPDQYRSHPYNEAIWTRCILVQFHSIPCFSMSLNIVILGGILPFVSTLSNPSSTLNIS